MRNNGKNLTRLLVAALLALAMTLSLTACQVEIPGRGTARSLSLPSISPM